MCFFCTEICLHQELALEQVADNTLIKALNLEVVNTKVCKNLRKIFV